MALGLGDIGFQGESDSEFLLDAELEHMSLEVEYESSDHDATSQTPINCNMAEEELN